MRPPCFPDWMNQALAVVSRRQAARVLVREQAVRRKQGRMKEEESAVVAEKMEYQPSQLTPSVQGAVCSLSRPNCVQKGVGVGEERRIKE